MSWDHVSECGSEGEAEAMSLRWMGTNKASVLGWLAWTQCHVKGN